MTHLVAMIDGSVHARSVCDAVAWIGRRADASVDLVHVIDDRAGAGEPVDLSGNLGLGARSALLAELAELDAQRAKLAHQKGRLLLEDAQSRLRDLGVEKVALKLRRDDLVDAVVELERSADLLVVGKRGEAADFAKDHLGSNLERVIRSTQTPTVVAPREFTPIDAALVAYDGSPMARRAVDWLAAHPSFRELPFTLLMAGEDDASHRAELDRAAAQLAEAGFPTEVRVEPGHPVEVIRGALATERFQLLVMGAYSHSRFRNLFIGSTTTEIIRTCLATLMLFR